MLIGLVNGMAGQVRLGIVDLGIKIKEFTYWGIRNAEKEDMEEDRFVARLDKELSIYETTHKSV